MDRWGFLKLRGIFWAEKSKWVNQAQGGKRAQHVHEPQLTLPLTALSGATPIKSGGSMWLTSSGAFLGEESTF